MRRLSGARPNVTFLIAIVLLGVSGAGAFFTILKLYSNQYWVRHTYDVEVALGDLESTLASVGRARIAYLNSGTQKGLDDFQSTVERVPTSVERVKGLTEDNQAQQALVAALGSNALHRTALSQESVRLKQQNESDSAKQDELTFQVASGAIETSAIVQQMRGNEDRLLEQRIHLSQILFAAVGGIFVASFAFSAGLFWIDYRSMDSRLKELKAAEGHLRELSVRLMKVQDEESRRFARELHDGLGQGLVAAKMVADSLLDGRPSPDRLTELVALIDDSVSATRTISYLLHPPMLDELGFAAAASWFIDGYSRRTGTEVSSDISGRVEEMPRYQRLSLFRILQEALTNVHRHSKSAKADVRVSVHADEVSLTVKDYGVGIPAEKLAQFNRDGSSMGVGLAGMRERVAELKGTLTIHSNESGTEIIVKMQIISDREISSGTNTIASEWGGADVDRAESPRRPLGTNLS